MSELSEGVLDSARMEDSIDAEGKAYKEAARLSVPMIAGYLLEAAGQRISAAALGLSDARPIRAWQDGGDIREENETRLRLLYRVVKTITYIYDDATARAFLRSSSPYLGDESPLSAIASDREADVLSALRGFLEG